MPNIKRAQDYPEEYYHLFKRAHEKKITLSFDTVRAAKNFRTEMYQFRSALREAIRDNPHDDDIAIAVLFAEGLTFSIDKAHNTLTIEKTDTVHAQKIREVL